MGWPEHVDVGALKQEVLDYLKDHPEAQDTLDGVVQWWLIRSRVMTGLEWVCTALTELEKEGSIRKVTGPDGQQWYQAARSADNAKSPKPGEH